MPVFTALWLALTVQQLAHQQQQRQLRPTDCSVVAFGATPDDDTRDDTAAVTRALAACAGGTVVVPPGAYRIDGTVVIGNTSLTPARNRTCDGAFQPFSSCPRPPVTTALHLAHGAALRRLAVSHTSHHCRRPVLLGGAGCLVKCWMLVVQVHSNSIKPVVSVVQFGCRLHGEAAVVSSENASPRGVVHLGPSSPFIPGAIQFATVSGVRITGQYRCRPDGAGQPGETSDNCLPTKNFSRTIFSNPAWNTTEETSGYEQCGYGFCACCPRSPGGLIAAECPAQYILNTSRPPVPHQRRIDRNSHLTENSYPTCIYDDGVMDHINMARSRYHHAVHGDPHAFHKLDCGHCDRKQLLGDRAWPGYQQNASFGRDGAVGLCIDSSEPVTTGAVYQNSFRDITITGMDVGMYAASQVNANEFDNLQFVAVSHVPLLRFCVRSGSYVQF